MENITGIVQVPVRHLCHNCLDMAKSYTRYAGAEEKERQEQRLRDGSASTPERIKAIWLRYGKGWDWSQSGPRAMLAEPIILRNIAHYEELANEPVKYTTFDFTREVIHNSEFTVTRVSCMGITVQETVELNV